MSHFPFESYLHSEHVQEYYKDVRRKNYLIKYINLLTIDNLDMVSLTKLVQNMIFFRNTFSRCSFLKFFNETFSEEEKKMLGLIVYEMFVKSKIGEIGEHKDFYTQSVDLYQYVDYKQVINKSWEEIKNAQQVGIVEFYK